jgi:ribonuclease E
MEENRNQHAVERRMKDAMRNDRARIQIGSISHFGLLEMSRQRLRLSINESISNLCPHCEGSGRVRSIDTAALQLLRSIEEEAQKGKMGELHITAHRDVVLFILNHKRSTIAEIEARFGLLIILLSDDSMIAPEYKVDRVGWQSKAQAKQLSRQSQQPRHANNNVKPDTSDSDKDDTIESEANEAPRPENDETGSEDGGAKRRRRGRRGGRRRRRRNGEDSQTHENHTLDDQTSDNPAASSPNGEDQASASTGIANDAVAANDDAAPKAKTSRGRGRRVTKTDPVTAENVPKDNEASAAATEPASSDLLNTAASDDNGDVVAAKKPARRRKKSASALRADNTKPEDSRAEAATKADTDSSADKPEKKPVRARKPKAKADAADKPEQDAVAARPAAKKPARKAAKKVPAKAADAENADTSANNGAPTGAPSKREPISSSPQDVVEIGSNAPKSRRSGWWSKS